MCKHHYDLTLLTALVALDLYKAFDTVSHAQLLEELMKIAILSYADDTTILTSGTEEEVEQF